MLFVFREVFRLQKADLLLLSGLCHMKLNIGFVCKTFKEKPGGDFSILSDIFQKRIGRLINNSCSSSLNTPMIILKSARPLPEDLL